MIHSVAQIASALASPLVVAFLLGVAAFMVSARGWRRTRTWVLTLAALIAYLAVTRQRHSRDALANLLWPEYDQVHARATLRRTLSALNKSLEGDWLRVDREMIGLNPHSVDPRRAERLRQ